MLDIDIEMPIDFDSMKLINESYNNCDEKWIELDRRDTNEGFDVKSMRPTNQIDFPCEQSSSSNIELVRVFRFWFFNTFVHHFNGFRCQLCQRF